MAAFPTTANLIGMVQSFELDDANLAAQWFPSTPSVNDKYAFDLVDWSRNKATYRHPDGAAGTQALRSRTRKEVNLPTLREKKTLGESTLRWLDAPGKNSPQLAREAIAGELQDLDGIIERTHEWVRWQLLTAGTVDIDIEGTTVTYDFGLSNTATAGTIWSTIATADPIGDLILWKEQVRKAGGVNPTECVLSTKALKYIFQCTKALSVLGESVKDNFAATGTVPDLAGMKVIVQDGGYRDSSDAFKYFNSDDGVDGNMCVLKAPGTLGVTAEGPPADSKAPDGVVGKFAKSWETEDPSARWVLECHTAMPGVTRINNYGAFTLW